MPAYGKIEEFKDGDDFTQYEERLGFYFTANGVAGDKQVPTFLSVIGPHTYALLRDLVAPAKVGDKTFAELCTILREHYNPKPSEIVQRFKFNSRVRGDGESINTFLAELRKLAQHCNYGNQLDNMLRDRVVCGVNDSTIQKRLLAEENLTLVRAMELATSMDLAARNAQQLATPVAVHSFTSKSCPKADKYKKPRTPKDTTKKLDKKIECMRCGGPHIAPDCKFKDIKCYACGTVGHFASKCLKTKKSHQGKRSTSQSHTHYFDAEDTPASTTPTDASESEYSLFNIQGEDYPPICVQVSVCGKPLKLELDCGSVFTVFSEHTYNTLRSELGDAMPELRPSKIRLRTWTQETVSAVGEMTVRVQYKNQDMFLPVVVGPGDGPALFGRSWLYKLKLDWREIGQSFGVHSVRSAPSNLQEVLDKYKSVFEPKLGKVSGVKAEIVVDPQSTPRFYKARPVPYALRDKVNDELDRLLREGIIEEVRYSSWAAPIVPVLKPDGSVRICGDYKLTVNAVSKTDCYPIPKTEDLLAALNGGQSFTKLDLSNAYLQIELDEKSRQYTCINTGRGLYRYTRLPFGISSSPGIFQRTVENILRGINNAQVRMDDILLTGPSNDAHIGILEDVLRRLDEAGVKLKREKCTFMSPSVDWVGHTIDAQGVRPIRDKLKAVQDMKEPANVSELKSLLGLVNYYGKYIHDLSSRLEPFHKLLRKDTPWRWGKTQAETYDWIREQLLSANVLVHYDPDKSLVLACDASPYGVGAVLSHVMEDGQERPIGYVSRTLTSAERNYAQVDKEGLAVVFGVKKFHSYLFGQSFTIYTDHRPLLGLLGLLGESKAVPPMASPRVQRWALTLSAYEYKLKYKPGPEHANADAFSRLPLPDQPSDVPVPEEVTAAIRHMDTVTLVSASHIKRWTRNDRVLSQVLHYTQVGWPESCPSSDLQCFWIRRSELSIQDGCVLWGSNYTVTRERKHYDGVT